MEYSLDYSAAPLVCLFVSLIGRLFAYICWAAGLIRLADRLADRLVD